MSRNLKLITIGGLILIVVALSVAYAALGQTLNITGTAQVTGNTWNVKLQAGSCTKTGSATAGTVTVSGTTATVSGVKLALPGDSVTCTATVVNNGTVAAKLSSFSKKSVSIVGTSTTATADANLISSNSTYTVTYDGSASPSLPVTLTAGATKNVIVKIEYKSTATAIPTGNVTIGNMGATLVYSQA